MIYGTMPQLLVMCLSPIWSCVHSLDDVAECPVCQFALSACWKLRNVSVQRINHHCLGWLCCWARFWTLQVVLATFENWQVISRFGSESEPNCYHWSFHTNTRKIAIGPVLPSITRHWNSTAWALHKYLSSNHIVTLSVRRLCCSSCSSSSSSWICDPTIIRWVGNENPRISCNMNLNFSATQRVLVGSQIWMREVNEWVELRNLYTVHIMIQSELKYWIAEKVAGTIKWNCSPGPTWQKNMGLCPLRVTTPPGPSGSGSLAVPDLHRGLGSSYNPDRSRVTQNRC